MGHSIRAVVARESVLNQLAELHLDVLIVTLAQGFGMAFVTDALHDSLDETAASTTPPQEPFYFLSPALLGILLDLSEVGPLAYLETDYFGGMGQQAAVLLHGRAATIGPLKQTITWNSARQLAVESGPAAINEVLRGLGVTTDHRLDEFDALGLGKYREMPERES